MEKLNDMPYIPDLKGMGFTAPSDNGNNELMQNMRDRYIWLLDNTDEPHYGMRRTQSNDYSY